MCMFGMWVCAFGGFCCILCVGVVCVVCEDFRVVRQREAERLERCQLQGEMMWGWADPRSTQVFPSMWEMLKLNCMKEPDTLIHNMDVCVHVSASTEAIRSTAGMCVSHHWMISVIWASQWATLSFLSATSLSSSSSCRLELFTFSNMLVSWREKTQKQQRWRSPGTIALWELDCLKHTDGGRGKLIWS